MPHDRSGAIAGVLLAAGVSPLLVVLGRQV